MAACQRVASYPTLCSGIQCARSREAASSVAGLMRVRVGFRFRAFHRCPLRFSEVFAGRTAAADRPIDAKAALTVVAGEDTSEYTARLGKWSRAVIDMLDTPSWWGTMVTQHVSRRPLHHLMCWLESVARRDGGGAWSNSGASGQPAVVELVTQRANATLEECGSLLGEEAWRCATRWQQLCCLLPDRSWRVDALVVLLQTAADVYRRIVWPSTLFPLRLAWLVAADPNVQDPMRLHTCQAFLASRLDHPSDCRPGPAVDTLSFMLQVRFREALLKAVRTGGAIDGDLHRMMLAVRMAERLRRLPVCARAIGVDSACGQLESMVVVAAWIGLGGWATRRNAAGQAASGEGAPP